MLPRRRTPSLGFTAGRRTTRPRPARGLPEALAREVAGDQGVDERRFGVETVARLWPDARGRAVDDLVGDPLAAMGGRAVEEEGGAGCVPHRGGIDGETRERRSPGLPFGLLAHRGPDVRVDGPGAGGGRGGIVPKGQRAPGAAA